MGYGSRALELLKQYYEMKIPNINEGVVKEVVTEITNISDEAVDLLKETIGNLLCVIVLDQSLYNTFTQY
jgi:N-acetyltransferase 10